MDPIELKKGDVILVAYTMYVFVREAKGTLYILPFAHRYSSDKTLITTCPRHIFDVMARSQPDDWAKIGNMATGYSLA